VAVVNDLSSLLLFYREISWSVGVEFFYPSGRGCGVVDGVARAATL
jgi:hypothetical protein